jgi:hypothetical protein
MSKERDELIATFALLLRGRSTDDIVAALTHSLDEDEAITLARAVIDRVTDRRNRRAFVHRYNSGVLPYPPGKMLRSSILSDPSDAFTEDE